MSRGHGRLQRAIITELMVIPCLTMHDLASVIYRCEITKSQLTNTRQAINKLVKEKIIKQAGYNRNGDLCWGFNSTRRPSETDRLVAKRLRAAKAPRLVSG